MKRRILVTGVGAIIGYGAIHSLRACRYPVHIVGTDIYADAVGQHWCDAFVQSVPVADAGYPTFLESVVEEHGIELVLPGIEQDVLKMARDADAFDRLSARLALNDRELICTAHDKWQFHLALESAGIPTIDTAIDGSFADLSDALGLPFLLKPRTSYASKGIHRIENGADLEYWRTKLGEDFMVQRIVGSEDAEFTVGLFGLGDRNHAGCICFQRKLSGEGATARARVVHCAELEARVLQLTRLFRPVGPTNFQFRRHNGEYLLLEVNPRLSSSTSLRTAFGFNECEMCIDYYLLGATPRLPRIRDGVGLRYIEDMVRYDGDSV